MDGEMSLSKNHERETIIAALAEMNRHIETLYRQGSTTGDAPDRRKQLLDALLRLTDKEASDE
jgi:hypothetical protein